MTRIGLICPAASGHLNPMTTLGYELKQRGHHVTLISILDAQPKTHASGLNFYSIGEAEFPIGSSAEKFSQLGKLRGLNAFRYTAQLFNQLTSVLLRDVAVAAQDLKIEILLIDQTSFGGTTVAEYLEIPYISVACALMLNSDPNVPPFITSWKYHPAGWARFRNQLFHSILTKFVGSTQSLITKYRHQWNLDSVNEPFSPFAQICQQPAEFEFPRQNLPNCFHFTGPLINSASRESTFFPFEQLTGKPLIYASLGTLQNRLQGVFQMIAAACEDLDVQLVIALGGGLVPEQLPHLSGNPIVVEYAPQLELLQRASLTITHAGMNTTLESLSNGVPMVAIPITNDQPGVAARIAWSGTGEVVTLKRLNVARLRQAIVKVLNKKSYRCNAISMQEAIKRGGGVGRAADIVEQVIRTGKTVQSEAKIS